MIYSKWKKMYLFWFVIYVKFILYHFVQSSAAYCLADILHQTAMIMLIKYPTRLDMFKVNPSIPVKANHQIVIRTNINPEERISHYMAFTSPSLVSLQSLLLCAQMYLNTQQIGMKAMTEIKM